jgi:hypothetical protein
LNKLTRKLAIGLGLPVFALLSMALANPANLPQTLYLPGAATTTAGQFPVFDGGNGSLPAVQNFNILAPAFLTSTNQGTAPTGFVPSITGVDGGIPPGIFYEEVGTLTSATSPAFTSLWHSFATAPTCQCTISSGASSINVCQTQQDAGFAIQYGLDAGPVTTVVIGTLAQDGGTWNYDCKGY